MNADGVLNGLRSVCSMFGGTLGSVHVGALRVLAVCERGLSRPSVSLQMRIALSSRIHVVCGHRRLTGKPAAARAGCRDSGAHKMLSGVVVKLQKRALFSE